MGAMVYLKQAASLSDTVSDFSIHLSTGLNLLELIISLGAKFYL